MYTVLTREQQRARKSASMTAAFNLELHLRNLQREILEGDKSKLPEFQQFIQYAPAEMKARLDPLA